MHTDHGAQYTSKAFAAVRVCGRGPQSMSAVGSSADNALAESFSATFKREALQGRRAFTDERQTRPDSFCWQHRPTPLRAWSKSPIIYENIRATSTMVAAAV
jgi:transposase InsO family protein